MSFSEQELEEFKAEAMDLLDTAEKSLLEIDGGAPFKTTFDSVFRSLHNLKGASGMMELLELQSHVHELETIFMSFKEKPSIPKDYVNLFLRGIDAAKTILNGQSVKFDFSVTFSVGDNPSPDQYQNAVSQMLDTPEIPLEAVVSDTEVAQKETAPSTSVFPVDQAAFQEFLTECDETVERVLAVLPKFESNQYTKDDIDSLYRDVHSLKGTAFLFSQTNLGNVSHLIESSLESVRNGTHSPNKELIDGIYKAIEIIELEQECIKSQVANEYFPKLLPALQKFLASAVEKLEPVKAKEDPAPLQESPLPQETPSLNTIATPTALPVEPLAKVIAIKNPIESATMTTQSEKIEPSAPTEIAKPVVEAMTAKDKESIEGASSIRVPVALLDNLMTLMGEMVLVRNQVLQFASSSDDQEFLNLSKHLNVVTSEIQTEMMKTRMQPIGNILSKFNRLVRDLSHELSKNIQLSLHGAETELDKSLLEAIKDPLTHIVRNSCDHGLETPEARKTLGKSPGGTVNIKSYHEGGQVVIEVTDDGRGLQKELLLKKGIEKGLITTDQSKQMSEKEIFNLIFAPGFSTAAKITNVSGRGVGMDVVRTNIEKIGGTVDLSSVAGKGTQIKIKIPLTLAIVPALIVKSAMNIFAIPQVKLVELVRVDQNSTDNKIEYLQGTPIYRLRGNLLPIVDLNKVIGLDSGNSGESKTIKNIAVLNAESCSFGLIVDEIHDTADIVVKPLTRLLKSLQIYSGATILGDGSVALILDVLGLSKVAKIGKDEGKQAQLQTDAAERNATRDSQDFLLVGLNAPAKHAIMLNYVHRLEEFKRSSIEMSGKQRVIRYRDSLLPIVSANKCLGYAESSNPAGSDIVPVVVVQKSGKLFGIEVDGILDTLSTEVDVDVSLATEPGYLGNLNLKDQLIVVIDPMELIAIESGTAQKRTSHNFSEQYSSANYQSLKILLAEDTKFFRKAVSELLEQAGHKVTLAVDGAEALETLQRNPGEFQLVISDIEMPRLNGFGLAKEIRKIDQLKNIPLMALSSRADASFIQEGKNAGFDMYLEKLQPNLLIQSIQDLMKKDRRAA